MRERERENPVRTTNNILLSCTDDKDKCHCHTHTFVIGDVNEGTHLHQVLNELSEVIRRTEVNECLPIGQQASTAVDDIVCDLWCTDYCKFTVIHVS